MRYQTIAALLLTLWTGQVLAGEIDPGAVVGGAVGGGLGAAIGSVLGGKEGAVVGAGVGGAVGAAVGAKPTDPKKARSTQPTPTVIVAPPSVVVERDVVKVHEEDCWPPGHCKDKHRQKHSQEAAGEREHEHERDHEHRREHERGHDRDD